MVVMDDRGIFLLFFYTSTKAGVWFLFKTIAFVILQVGKLF